MKSLVAFKFSFEKLTENASNVYFWTVTAPEVLDRKEFTERFRKFGQQMRRKFPHVPILRVFEFHPDGHGLHAHLVVCSRLGAAAVWQISRSVGLGRVHVKIIPRSTGGKYLSKYLRKEMGERNGAMRGLRKWAAINFSEHTRVANIISTTLLGAMCKLALAKKIMEPFSYGFTSAFTVCEFCRKEFFNLVRRHEILIREHFPDLRFVVV